MKVLLQRLERDLSGTIKLVSEVPEDMWHIYNLLAVGDVVTASTFRKVQKSSDTGSSVQNRVKFTITLEVENIFFDAQASQIRLKGKNVEENEYVKMGQYHTLELGLQKSFGLKKAQWDSVYMGIVQTACDPTKSAEIAAVVMQHSLAHVCLVTEHMTIVRQRIEVPIPKKRAGSISQYEKAVTRFYEAIMDAILRHIDFAVVKVVVFASPAFLKDEVFDYIMGEAVKRELRPLIENRSKFVLCHSTSGHKHALKDVLADSTVMSKIQDTHAASEVRTLDRFFEMLDENPDRAFYGLQHVQLAHQHNAIDTLLITDALFRCADVRTRRKYVDLVESVRENSGDVKIFSTLHVSGEQLAQITGIAAILRFPLPDIEDTLLHQESKEEEEKKIDASS
eukprot:TRINITY_DN1426_c0_g1_i3.p1 TRINITY_DN1426_c0_g1~~TRINITY_DN1426_c0_g1_i3.p1  ORF type:complete len:395 (+),score=98.42 TRINITY_DN1426_c0_g1_i3:124-1308(+)